MTHFNGKIDAAQWWTTFMSFITLQRYEEWEAILCFPFYLDGIAKQWWHMLDTSANNSLNHIKTAFLNRFRPLEEDDVGLTNLRQLEHESVTEYIHRALGYNKDRSVIDKYLIKLTYRGMKEQIQQIVIPQNPTSMTDLLKKAVTAEMTVNMRKTNNTSVEDTIHKAISSLENSMTERLANHFQSVAAISTPPQNKQQIDNSTSAYNNQQMCFNPYQQPFQMPPPYMYQPVQHQSVQYPQAVQYPQQNMQPQNSYQNSRPNYANKQNGPCKGCGYSLMNWNSLLFSTFIVLISLCVIIESTNQEDIIQCLKNGAEFRQESRLFLAKECWLQTFRDHILCSKMAIFVLIAVSFMYCKAPRMAMVMSVMQFFSCVESQTPPSFIYRRPTEEPQ
ncbi:uncharacterized protein [Mytilus edulis]|uniref:uncharacterized protein n=1 Tax=Mytilus edulis TaxID=6550 RepID=UPI0039EE5CCC